MADADAAEAPSESLRHPPLQWLSPVRALLIGGALVALAIILLVKVSHLDPAHVCDGRGVTNLAFAGTVSRAEQILDCVGHPEHRLQFLPRAKQAVAWDYALIGVYVLAIGFWCAYGGLRARRRPTRHLGFSMVALVVFAGLWDVAENLILRCALLEPGPLGRDAVEWTSAFSLAKWLLFVPAALTAFTFLVSTVSRVLRGSLGSTTWPGFIGGVPNVPMPPRPVTDAPRVDQVGTTLDQRRAKRFQVPGTTSGDQPVGIGLSGGGIRAAAFAVGAMEVFVQDGEDGSPSLYRRADYLATVSGGGYTGGASRFVAKGSEFLGYGGSPPFAAGTPEVDHVRRYAHFLWWPATKGQWWQSTRMYVSGVLLALVCIAFNVAVLVGLLFVVVRPVGWGVRAVFIEPDGGLRRPLGNHGALDALVLVSPLIVMVGVFLWKWLKRLHFDSVVVRAAVFVLLLGGGIVTIGLVVRYGFGPDRWWTGSWGWRVGTVLVLVGLPIVLALLSAPTTEGRKGIGRLIPAVGWLIGGVVFIVSAGWLSDAITYGPRAEVTWRPLALIVAVLLFIVVFVLVTALGRVVVGEGRPGSSRPAAVAAAVLVGLVAAALAVGGFARWQWGRAADPLFEDWVVWLTVASGLYLVYLTLDQKRWSPHQIYKSRLAGTFSPVRVHRGEPDPTVQPLPYSVSTTLSTWAAPLEHHPTPLVCAACYDTRDDDDTLGAYQFTFAHDFVGGPEVGWMRTIDFEASLGRTNDADGTMLAAMAISGAAVSPALGQINLGGLNVAIAIFNLRLGVWLPNPRYVNELRQAEAAHRADMEAANGPTWTSNEGPAIRWLRQRRYTYLLKEIASIHDFNDRFVYVTDGGQVDNLGLLELLARRCRLIVLVDASGDATGATGTFDDVRAIAYRRYGVTFAPLDQHGTIGEPDPPHDNPTGEPLREITPGALTRDLCTKVGDSLPGQPAYYRAAVTRLAILYRGDGHDLPAARGVLILAKAVLTEDAPACVREHAASHPRFPKDSTADQFLDPQQFDAYLRLGRQVAEEARKLVDLPSPSGSPVRPVRQRRPPPGGAGGAR